jgi:dihydropyrimidinase
MTFDLVVRGATVVLPDAGAQRLDLAVSDGMVAAHLSPDADVDATETLDASGKVVLPGLIDPHQHMGLGDPQTDYLTETGAAAIAGFTTLMNFLMTPEPYAATYHANRELADRQAHVDYALHAVISTREQMAELDGYIADYGMTSFKFFMSFRGEEGAYIGLLPIDDGLQFELFELLGQRAGTVVCVHTENIEVVWAVRDRLQQQGRDDLEAWHESRPPFTEAEAAVRTMLFARETGASAYIVHASTQQTLEEVAAFRARGGSVFLETCPHYLTHTYESPVGLLGKQNPPLRAPSDLEALWAAILDGTIDTIGSDHAPRLGARKQGSVWTASPGQPNMPVILPVLLDEGVRKRGMPIERVAEITAANPAKIFGMWPQKGSLQVGADADFTVVDMDLEKTVSPQLLQGRADYSIYDGMTLRGWPVLTVLRGAVVARNGELTAQPGAGRFIHRKLG